METIVLHITVTPRQPWAEILVAQLAEMGFDAFEDLEDGLKAYGPENQIDLKKVLNETILNAAIREQEEANCEIKHEIEKIAFQNWNAVWEAGFEPVHVEDQLHILAPFHKRESYKGMIVEIQPHMSFGTGHHQTTWLMSWALLQLPKIPRKVLDMGAGTGVLAIIAEKLGAEEIVAIDIEDWSVENTIENAERNHCTRIESLCGDVELIAGRKFALILANINKNVLKRHLPAYAQALEQGGKLYLSGFFASDADEMNEAAKASGFEPQKTHTREGWAMLELIKPIEK